MKTRLLAFFIALTVNSVVNQSQAYPQWHVSNVGTNSCFINIWYDVYGDPGPTGSISVSGGTVLAGTTAVNHDGHGGNLTVNVRFGPDSSHATNNTVMATGNFDSGSAQDMFANVTANGPPTNCPYYATIQNADSVIHNYQVYTSACAGSNVAFASVPAGHTLTFQFVDPCCGGGAYWYQRIDNYQGLSTTGSTAGQTTGADGTFTPNLLADGANAGPLNAGIAPAAPGGGGTPAKPDTGPAPPPYNPPPANPAGPGAPPSLAGPNTNGPINYGTNAVNNPTNSPSNSTIQQGDSAIYSAITTGDANIVNAIKQSDTDNLGAEGTNAGILRQIATNTTGLGTNLAGIFTNTLGLSNGLALIGTNTGLADTILSNINTNTGSAAITLSNIFAYTTNASNMLNTNFDASAASNAGRAFGAGMAGISNMVTAPHDSAPASSPSMQVTIGAYTIDCNPLHISSIASLATWCRAVMTFGIALMSIRMAWTALEAYIAQMGGVRQASTAGQEFLGFNAAAPSAQAMAIGITLALATVPAFFVTWAGTTDYVSNISGGIYSTASGAMITALTLMNAFMPLDYMVASAVGVLVFRMGLGVFWAVATTIARHLTGV